MSKLQSFRVFLDERLTAAAMEIFGAFEETVAEYQEENDRLRRLLRITPEIKLCTIDSLQLSVSEEILPEQQHCEQEWSPSLGQENPELPQIKEEQEELRTSLEEEQLQGLEADIKFTPSCVKSECDQEDPLQSFTSPQTQTVENRESDPKQVVLTPFVTVTHFKGLYIPCDPPDNQNNASSHSSAVSSDPVGLDSSPRLDPSPSMAEHCSKPSTGRPCTCPVCAKTFKLKGYLSKHMRIHTGVGEKPFSCGDCGKSFNLKGNLKNHMLTHTGNKSFSCGACGKSFIHKGSLKKHKLTHTGEKPFSCSDCGKSFNQKGNLRNHKLTHTGEKPFSCDGCGKSFTQKSNLLTH
uniref:zinc finger protein 184-like n=1 Tax=Oncorhynchus gorbuscha TaxID=8017 RepID=UPI001EAF1BF8